ncbi:hypothetical protein [Streptomyces griseoincarnatus]|uniref:hypothetical protein n=1 Tax=Streptomyces griseoincarnatus TaxID=29305 RepID=UPI0027E2768D|nr:hypothetical protein [Streptomyces griseoincarnatus]
MRPSRAFAASSPAARPTTCHSAVAASLSLRRIIASACARSAAVSSRPASRAVSSSAVRMSTFTTLAVTKTPPPEAYVSPSARSSAAADTLGPSVTPRSLPPASGRPAHGR